MRVLKSKQDKSINVVVNGFEARFVQRSDDYFIIYVSSQKGCAQHCRMCHLTATGQTDTAQASIRDFSDQVIAVLKQIDVNDFPDINKVHINFMARGEPMTNFAIADMWNDLSSSLAGTVYRFFGRKKHLSVRFIISTIFPEMPMSGRQYVRILSKFALSDFPPSIYYSLYSTDKEIRKKWLPRALPVEKGLGALNMYNSLLDMTGFQHQNKIHHAIIDGVNSAEEEAVKLTSMLSSEDYRFLKNIRFNIVRYNPYDKRYGREACLYEIERIASVYRNKGHETDIIPRVGKDVFASCGMFLEKTDMEAVMHMPTEKDLNELVTKT